VPERIYQFVARRVLLKAYLSSDHLSPATGKTIPVQISKNGAAFANPAAGTVNATEIANGWYYVDLAAATDMGTQGPFIVRGTEGTIDPAEDRFQVVEPEARYFGSVTGSSSTTGFADSALPTRPDDTWRYRVIIVDSGTYAGAATDIKTYVDSTKLFTFTALPGALTAGDKYRIV
jgi:hypothetical protein